jgi:hypothetical protein
MSSQSAYRVSGLLSSTVGTSVIAMAQVFGIPTHADEAQPSTKRNLYLTACQMPDTKLSTVTMVQPYADVSMLLSDAAASSIGAGGLKRLKDFLQLEAGWDGRGSKAMDLKSVAVFSRFFSESGLIPQHIGIFMSAQGNVVVNWPDQSNQLIELEFHPSSVDYFIERNGLEGTVAVGDIGFTKLSNLVAEPVET